MRIRWTRQRWKISNISRYIEEQRSLATANRVCRRIYEGIQVLQRFLESGKMGIEEGTREIAYRVKNAGDLEILRIWHGARQRK